MTVQAERNCLGTFLSEHHGALFLSAWWGSQMYVSVEWLLENNVSLLFACVIAVRKVDTAHNVMRHNYFFFGGGGGTPLFWGHNLKSEQNFKSYWLRADELEIWFKRECWGHWTKFIWMTYFKAIWNDVAQQQEWTDHKPVGRSCFKSLCRNWVTLVLTWSTVSYWSCDHVSTPSDWSDSRRSWVLVNSSSECPCAASAFSTSL